MRILQLSGFYPPTVGGIESYVRDLSESLVEQGHKVLVIARYPIGKKPLQKEEVINGVRVKWVYSRWNSKISTLWAWLRVLLIALREDVDVVHAHTVVPISTTGRWIKFWKSCKLITTIHESQFLFGMNHFWYRLVAKYSLSKCDYIYCASDELKNVAIRLNTKQKVHSMNNAVNTKRFFPEKKDLIREECGVKKNVPIIVTARRLVKKNGVIYLIRAVAEIIKTKEVFCFVIGDGPEKKRIEEEIHKRGLSKYVFLKGAVENEAVRGYLNSADVFVLPSLKEATSIAGLEAMACALPVVGTEVGGIPQIIIPGKTGMLCKPKDARSLAKAVLEVIRVGSENMGLNARKLVESKFSWDSRAKEISQIYERL